MGDQMVRRRIRGWQILLVHLRQRGFVQWTGGHLVWCSFLRFVRVLSRSEEEGRGAREC